MYTDKLLHYAIPAQKKYHKAYMDDEMGLCAIHEDYVQITREKFSDLMKQFQGELSPVVTKLSYNDYEASLLIDGVIFLTIGTKKEFQEMELL